MTPILKLRDMIWLELNNHQTSKEMGSVFTAETIYPWHKLTDINFLHEYLTIELNIKNKLCVLVALYRSPTQSHNKFSSFIIKLESTLQAITLRKPFLTMVLRDFNVKKKLWFDQENTSSEGSILNDLMAQYGLTQILHEEIHILESSVFCIDLQSIYIYVLKKI